MPIKKEKLEEILHHNFPSAKLEIIDLAGDDDHYSVTISDKIFAGKTRIEQHKMVHAVLAPEMDKRIHAVQIKTKNLDS